MNQVTQALTADRESRLSRFGTFSILLTAFVWIFEASVFGPAQSVIQAAFPGSTAMDVQIAMMIPMATGFVVSIFAGWWAKRIDKKIILMLGLLIYGITGLMPILSTGITQMIILRAITGIGVGLVLPMTNAIIADHTIGKTRAKLIGWATAVCSISSMGASIAIGFLMVYTWKATFYAFVVPLIIFVIVAIAVPKSPPAAKQEGVHTKLSRTMYWYAIGMFLVWMSSCWITLNLAFIVAQEKLFALELIGIATVFVGLGSFVGGAIFPQMSKLFKRNYTVFFLIIYGIGYLVLFPATTLPAILLGNFLVGWAGQGALSTNLYNLVAIKSKSEAEKDQAMGLMAGCTSISGVAGIFCMQLFFLFNPNPTAMTNYRWLLLFGAITLIVAAIIAIFLRPKKAQFES